MGGHSNSDKALDHVTDFPTVEDVGDVGNRHDKKAASNSQIRSGCIRFIDDRFDLKRIVWPVDPS
jgi:hypothetical protein